ncbi:hypothetical protein [Legionella bononiensis]|uniref:Effector protein B, substrate of the Dot/Icm secretion system n=1 Tax=Legionella bononiensis TaxID=2793102 RepID=A0ABS1WCW1_9GAMM|nr:hypothetical protein [Legionella bononiensis]MBL7479047.1 hypothetical protein [Legionella bononiensis]MBL7527180.1 hypothetical protein [Legionella bononiensis]MBL7562149.1 hypothetical protein [Legionella bononiensis]
MPKVQNVDKNAFEVVCKKLEGIKDELKHSHSLDILKSIITRYDEVNLKSESIIRHTQADQKANKKFNRLTCRIDELIFNSMCKALEGMKHELKHCNSSDNLNTLIQHRSQINTNTDAVLRHITKNPAAQDKIIKLEIGIAEHLKRKKQEITLSEQKNNEKTDENSITERVNYSEKSGLHTEHQLELSTTDKTQSDKKASETNDSAMKHIVSKILTRNKQSKTPKVTFNTESIIINESDSSDHMNSTEHRDQTHSEDNSVNEPGLNFQQMKARELQLSQFDKLVKQLMIKRDEFHKRYPLELDDDVKKPYGAACQLVHKLTSYSQSYKDGMIDLKGFKDQATKELREQRKGVLSEHRGCKELMANILLALGTLGVGYVLAALFTQSFTPIKLNTSTVNQLDETLKAVEQSERTFEARIR